MDIETEREREREESERERESERETTRQSTTDFVAIPLFYMFASETHNIRGFAALPPISL